MTNSYTELANGMAHLVNGRWIDSSDQIQLTRTGAEATTSQHRVAFLGNINAGPVDVTMPDGRHLAGKILGLSYLDVSSGNSVLIAELKDSIGELVVPPGNQVLYPDSFTDFRADVLYVNGIGEVEQLVILRQQPPSPPAHSAGWWAARTSTWSAPRPPSPTRRWRTARR